MKPIEHAVADMRRPGEASLDANAYGTPAPTEGTASIKLAGRAVKATTAQPEVLDPWAKSEAWHRLGTPPLPPSRTHPGMLGMLLQEAPNAGTCRHGLKVPPLPPQEGLSTSECRPTRAPQTPPPPLPREISGYPELPLREAPLVGMHRHDQLP
jgi:hypothetical protein